MLAYIELNQVKLEKSWMVATPCKMYGRELRMTVSYATWISPSIVYLTNPSIKLFV